jgi:hypothetical protein
MMLESWSQIWAGRSDFVGVAAMLGSIPRSPVNATVQKLNLLLYEDPSGASCWMTPAATSVCAEAQRLEPVGCVVDGRATVGSQRKLGARAETHRFRPR